MSTLNQEKFTLATDDTLEGLRNGAKKKKIYIYIYIYISTLAKVRRFG